MSGRQPVAYIVSMISGLDAFVYREVEELMGKDIPIVLFATKFNKDDVLNPKAGWPYYHLPAWLLVLHMPLLILRALAHPLLLWEAIRHRGVVDFLFALYFAPRMRRHGVRQIHCHCGDHKLFIGYYCHRLLDVPLSVTIHAHEFYTNPNPRLFRLATRACDRVFPIAQRWLNRLRDEYGIPENSLRLNRLFVDTRVYRPAPLRVLSVGRFTERKGFHLLMDAAQQLSDLDIAFIFVGFGPLNLRAMAEQKGIADRVIVYDKMDQKQLRMIYQSVDIYCLPSITTREEGAEGIPVVLMEAMACGLPVVATRCGAVDELVEEILVDEGSPEQLASAIRQLAGDPALRRRQGEKNRKIVQEKYSISNVERFAAELVLLQRDRSP